MLTGAMSCQNPGRPISVCRREQKALLFDWCVFVSVNAWPGLLKPEML